MGELALHRGSTAIYLHLASPPHLRTVEPVCSPASIQHIFNIT
jgi:hypothetical protein